MKKILIVEDELIPANYLKRVLTKEGYGVVGMAASAQKAFEKAINIIINKKYNK